MNVEKLGLPVNSCKRSIGRDFTSADGDPLRGQSPQIYESASNTMRVNSCVTEMCEPRPGPLSRSCSPGTTIPNHALPGLNSIGFWDSTGRQNWGLEARRNDGLALYFVETGNMVFMADDRRYSLRAGNFGIARPWQLHQLGDPYIGPCRVHWLAVDVGARTPNCQWRWPDWVSLTQADLAELTQKLCHNKMPVCRGTPEIGGIFRQVAKSVVHWGERHSISRMIANLNQLFVNLLETTMTQAPNKSSSQDSSRRAVELFLKSLEESPANCDDIKTLEHVALGRRVLANIENAEF